MNNGWVPSSWGDFTLLKDASETQAFQIVQDGSPVNLTGASVELLVVNAAANPAVIASFNTNSGQIVPVNAAIGSFAFNIAAAAIENFPEGDFFHFLRFILSGQPVEVVRGPFHIRSGGDSLFSIPS